MSSTEKDSIDGVENSVIALDAKGLCDILRTCHKAGVSQFVYGSLKVTFGAAPETVPISYPTVGKAHPATVPESPGPDDSILKEKFERSQDDLNLLMIEQPDVYEQMILRDDFEPETDVGH